MLFKFIVKVKDSNSEGIRAANKLSGGRVCREATSASEAIKIPNSPPEKIPQLIQ